MVGTASLPHVLMRYFTTPSVREARVSVAWSLLFIFILYFTAPAYAAFAKWTMLDLVASGLTPENIADKAGWMMRWAAADNTLVQICGKAAVDAAAIAAACAEAGVTNIGFANINLNADMIVLATPEMAGMPYVISGLVAAGGLAAALSTADGLLLAIANALSHDIYYKMIDQNAPTARRLVVSRVLLVIVAIAAAYVASTKPADILAMVSWAFSLAAAGLFPALVLGVWWKRANSAGAIAGMIAGFGLCLYYLLGTRYGAIGFYEMWSGLSTATPEAIAKYRRAQGSARSRGSRRSGRGAGCARQACPDDRQLVGGEEPLGGGVRPAGRLRRHVRRVADDQGAVGASCRSSSRNSASRAARR